MIKRGLIVKKRVKILSCTTAAAIALAGLPFFVQAQGTEKKVRIVVENNTFSAADGAAWEGTLIDEWVEFEEGVSAVELLEKTLSAHGYSQTGAKDNYVTDINGLSAGADTAKMGGWMVGFDDWYGNGGITTIKPENGDEIVLSYSLNWGADIGYDYMSSSTKLTSLETDTGKLSPDFSGDTTEYELLLPEGTEFVKITPTVENKGYRFKIYKNAYTPDDDTTDYKRTQPIQMSYGDTIYIGVGHKQWHSYISDDVTETVYKINISGGTDGSSDESSYVPVSSEVSSQVSQIIEKSSVDTDSVLSDLNSKLTPADNNYMPGDEWLVLTRSRLGIFSSDEADGYLSELAKSFKTAPPKNATDFAKYTLVLTALGKDPAKWNDMDLTAALSDFDFAVKQGINGAAYSLLALDSKNYDIPAADKEKTQNTREKMISFLLDAQLKDGGWTFFGDNYEPDMTGIVIQALAPYYNKDSNVKEAVDKAVALLSEKQNDDGTYTSYGEPNSENSSQVIIALSALGIDADKDERFVKNGFSALDGLKAFYISDDKNFSHSLNGEKNALSTMQAYEALCSYKRFLNKQTSLYDMTDVKAVSEEVSKTESSKTTSSLPEQSSKQSSAVGNSSTAAGTAASVSGTPIVATGDSGYGAVIAVMIISSAAVLALIRKRSKQ